MPFFLWELGNGGDGYVFKTRQFGQIFGSCFTGIFLSCVLSQRDRDLFYFLKCFQIPQRMQLKVKLNILIIFGIFWREMKLV